MTRLRAHNIVMSVDGYMAGPDQGPDNPLGTRGEELHEWLTSTRAWREAHARGDTETGPDDTIGATGAAATDPDEAFVRRADEGIGATIMGRNMFGPVRGPWPDESWTGWWGDNPPFHHPVYVLTHHPRAPITLDGGTTFHFVTGGIEAALEQAAEGANGLDVRLGGGAATIRAYLRAGLLDVLHVAMAPKLLGSGERIFTDEVSDAMSTYRITEHVPTQAATHIVLTH